VIILDASVIIAHFNRNDAHHRSATDLLAESSAEPLAVSAITMAEVLVTPARAGKLEVVTAALCRLGISSVSLDSDTPARLVRG